MLSVRRTTLWLTFRNKTCKPTWLHLVTHCLNISNKLEWIILCVKNFLFTKTIQILSLNALVSGQAIQGSNPNIVMVKLSLSSLEYQKIYNFPQPGKIIFIEIYLVNI